ncbi:hypothetical protein [Thiothrix subterranea]|uniref:Uncharacterized protein n=1 Tax=Thiothrix subterranea TaxID=2735563 RepID=A0AA51MJV8_9GAMM|nr:hypothetical protein [Thiothrix subterranea]MDQ5770761.1 hypothetical protein [Thiothrix subterranea]WML85645.1 hypothetical protein RCG00_15215 [Thiothrix subterranea]
MDELSTNSLSGLEKLELMDEFDDLADKIDNNQIPESAKIELRKSFDILLALFDDQITPSGIEKIRLV